MNVTDSMSIKTDRRGRCVSGWFILYNSGSTSHLYYFDGANSRQNLPDDTERVEEV